MEKSILSVIILVCAFLGYYLFLAIRLSGKSFSHEKTTPFGMLFLCISSGIAVVLYLCGLLHGLQYGVCAVILGGLISLAVSLIICIRQKSFCTIKKAFTDYSFVFFVISLIWLYVTTRFSTLSHYDDFTHWYRICKVIHAEHAFPTTPDIRFVTYPPGTAVWNYFVTRFIGFGPSECFFAQGLMNLFCCASFFSVIPDKAGNKPVKGIAVAACLVATVILPAMNITYYALLVDGLLGLMTLHCLITVLTASERSETATFMMLLPVCIFLPLVKTSGLLLSIMVLVYWIIQNKGQNRKKAIRYSMLIILLSVGLSTVYSIYAKSVYGDLSGYSQVTSISRYWANLTASWKHSFGICVKYLQMITAAGSGISQVKAIWVVFGVMYILSAWLYSREKREELKEFRTNRRYLVLFLVIYSIGLVLAYICTMAVQEASYKYLNSFYRYLGTFTMVAAGFASVWLIRFICLHVNQRTKVFALSVLIALMMCGTAWFNCGYIWGRYYYQPEEYYTEDLWNRCTGLNAERWDYNEDIYVVIWNPSEFKDKTVAHFHHVLTTYFRSNQIRTINIHELAADPGNERWKKTADSGRYLVCFGDFSSYATQLNEALGKGKYTSGITER